MYTQHQYKERKSKAAYYITENTELILNKNFQSSPSRLVQIQQKLVVVTCLKWLQCYHQLKMQLCLKTTKTPNCMNRFRSHFNQDPFKKKLFFVQSETVDNKRFRFRTAARKGKIWKRLFGP